MTAITSTSPIPAGSIWAVDHLHSTVGFAVKHMVVSTFRSSFEDYDAKLSANEDGTLNLEGRVKAASIAIKDPNLLGHVTSADFFDADNHEYVTFSSTLVRAENGELTVDGELTIKGNSHPIQARGVITEPHMGLGDIEKVGLELETTVDRTQYGLNWNAPLPKGGFALGNDVKLQINLEFAQA